MFVFTRLAASFLVLLFLVGASFAQTDKDTKIQMGLSQDVVEISSSFDGTEIIIFGSIENGDRKALEAGEYDIIVMLAGPKEIITVRRRERKLGVWINGTAREFTDVPSSYSITSTRPFNEVVGPEEARILQIGLKNLNVEPVQPSTNAAETAIFKQSLSRLKSSVDLYLEQPGGISFLTPSLFKARLAVPANVPIGSHTARAFLFKKGKFINSQFIPMQVKKIGFEQFTYDFAHEHGLLFGFICVFVAAFTGWLASVIFRKN